MGRRLRRRQRLPSPVAVAGTARREFARRWQKARLPPPLPDLLPSAVNVARPRTWRQEARGNDERPKPNVEPEEGQISGDFAGVYLFESRRRIDRAAALP